MDESLYPSTGSPFRQGKEQSYLDAGTDIHPDPEKKDITETGVTRLSSLHVPCQGQYDEYPHDGYLKLKSRE
jgi:hypothetical protein